MRLLLGVILLALAMPVQAQTTVKERLEKARTEINATKNAANRALYAIDKALETVETPPAEPVPVPVVDVPEPTEPVPTEPEPDPTPEPEAPPNPPETGGTVLTKDLNGGEFIQGPTQAQLLTGWPLSPTAAPDVVGAHRFSCTAGPAFSDDPIVYPGQAGKSHRHRFFGAILPEGYAGVTYAGLRNRGDVVSSCQGLLLAKENRTVYWMPELYMGLKAYIWESALIYYKRYPENSTRCDGKTPNTWGAKTICTTIPNQIKFIWGYDMITSTVPTGSTKFWSQATTSSPVIGYDDIQKAFEATPIGGRFGVESKAPGCWNGKETDTPNHRSHVDNEHRNPQTGLNGCKPDHPVNIPGFTFKPHWVVTAAAKAYYAEMKAKFPNARCIIQFSSDPMARLTNPDLPCGGSAHMDYLENWDFFAKQAWVDNCINKLLSCNSGATGDGRAIPGAGRPKAWVAPEIIAAGWLEDLPADIVATLENGHVLH